MPALERTSATEEKLDHFEAHRSEVKAVGDLGSAGRRQLPPSSLLENRGGRSGEQHQVRGPGEEAHEGAGGIVCCSLENPPRAHTWQTVARSLIVIFSLLAFSGNMCQ